MPPCSPRSSRSRVTSSTNSGTPPVRAATSSTTSLRQCMTGRKLRHHVAHLRAIERRQRDRAVMRTHAPGWPELGPSRREDEQRRQGAALGDAAQDIERRRIGPMQILEGQHHRLHLGARHRPIGQRRQLPAPQFLRRQGRACGPGGSGMSRSGASSGAFSAGSSLT